MPITWPPVSPGRGIPRLGQLGWYFGNAGELSLPLSYQVAIDGYVTKDGSGSSDPQMSGLRTFAHPGGPPPVPFWGVILASLDNSLSFKKVISGQADAYYQHQIDLMVQGGFGTGGPFFGYPVLVRLSWETNIGTQGGGWGGSGTNIAGYSLSGWATDFQLAFQHASAVMRAYAVTQGVFVQILFDYVPQSMGIPFSSWMPNPNSWNGIGWDCYTQCWSQTSGSWPGYASGPALNPAFKGVPSPTTGTPPNGGDYTSWWCVDFAANAIQGGGPYVQYDNMSHHMELYNATLSQPNGDETNLYHAVQLCAQYGKYLTFPEMGTASEGNDHGTFYRCMAANNPASPAKPAFDYGFYSWIQRFIAACEDAGVPFISGVMWNLGLNVTIIHYHYQQSGLATIEGGRLDGGEWALMDNLANAIGGTPPPPSLTVNPLNIVGAGTAVAASAFSRGYTLPTDLTKLKVNFGAGFVALPGGAAVNGNILTFTFTANTAVGAYTIAIEDTSQTPTLVSLPVNYSVAPAAPLGYAITVPTAIPQQTGGQQFFVQFAFNYIPDQSKIQFSSSSGGVSLTGLPAGTVWDAGGQRATVPVTNNSQVPHFFEAVDTTWVPLLVSAVITYQVGTSGGGGTIGVAVPPLNGPSLSVSQLTTEQESSPGAGVTQSVTFTGLNLASPNVFWGAINTSGGFATGPTPITLDSHGQLTVNAFLAATGYKVRVQNLASSPTVFGDSNTINITDGTAAPTIQVSSPGQQYATTVGGTVTVNEVITTTNLTGNVFGSVKNAANVVIGGPFTIPLTVTGINGTATYPAIYHNTGDYFFVANAPTSPTATGQSSAITILNPITKAFYNISDPGINLAPTAGAAVTKAMTVTASGAPSTTFYYRVEQPSGAIELAFQPGTFVNNSAVVTVPFNFTGDVLTVWDNPTAPTVQKSSDPIQIVQPSQTPSAAIFDVSDPGTQVEPSSGAGVDYTGVIQTYGKSGPMVWGLFNASNVLQGSYTNTVLNTGSGPAITAPTAIPPQKAGQVFSVEVAFNYVVGPANQANIQYSQSSVAPAYTALPAGATWDSTGQLLTIPISNSNQVPHFFAVRDTVLGINSGTPVTYQVGATGGGGTVTVAAPIPLLTFITSTPFTVHFGASGWYVKAVDVVPAPTITGQSPSVSIVDAGSPTPTISLAFPGNATIPSAGAVAQVAGTVNTTNITPGTQLWWQVQTSAGAGEETFTAFLTTGDATPLPLPVAASGDIVVVVDNPTTPVTSGRSAPITLTVVAPPPSLFIGVPTAPIDTGGTNIATFAAQFTASGINGSSLQVRVDNPDGSLAQDFIQVPLTFDTPSAAGGTGQHSFTITQSGSTLFAVDNIASPTIAKRSTPITFLSVSQPATITVNQPSPLNVGVQTITGTISLTGIQPVQGQFYGSWDNFTGARTSTSPGAFLWTISGQTFSATVDITNILGSLSYSFNANPSGGTWATAWMAQPIPSGTTTATLNTVALPVLPGPLPLTGTISDPTAVIDVCLRPVGAPTPVIGDPDVVQTVVTPAISPATGGVWSTASEAPGVIAGGAGIAEAIWYSINNGAFVTPFPGQPTTITPQPVISLVPIISPQYTATNHYVFVDLNYILNPANLGTIGWSQSATTTPSFTPAVDPIVQISQTPGSQNTRLTILVSAPTVGTRYFQVRDGAPPGGGSAILTSMLSYAVVLKPTPSGSPIITPVKPLAQQVNHPFTAFGDFNYIVSSYATIDYTIAGSPTDIWVTAPLGSITHTPGGSRLTLNGLAVSMPSSQNHFKIRDRSPPGGGGTLTSANAPFPVTVGPPPLPAATEFYETDFDDGSFDKSPHRPGTQVIRTGWLP